MTCVICKKGDVLPGTTTGTFERDGFALVVRHVPALVSGNCGEGYVDQKTTETLLKTAEEGRRAGVQVDVREFAAA